MVGGFRVQTVSIEGFKGFTKNTEIDLRGRHVFLLGQNGNGKSSIIEAIRWGLFGATANDVVANRDYTGRCRVELTLIRDGKQWNLRRTLNRGVTGGSDGILTDEHGTEFSIREILPQLDSVDSGEGMYIIFAPQGGHANRAAADLSAFARPIFEHLGLIQPRALLSQLNRFISEQESMEASLDVKLTDVRKDIDKRVFQLERQRGGILKSPPWGNQPQPSYSASESKTRKLLQEITGQEPGQALAGVSLQGLIHAAEDALQERHNRNKDKLAKELADTAEQRARIESAVEIQTAVQGKQARLKELKEKLGSLTNGASLDELQRSFNDKQQEVNFSNVRAQLIEGAMLLLDHEHNKPVVCPICEEMHDRDRLQSHLNSRKAKLTTDSNTDLTEMKERLDMATEVYHEDQVLQTEVARLTGRLADIQVQIPDGDWAILCQGYLEREQSIEMQINKHGDWVNKIESQMSSIRGEQEFHNIQAELVKEKQLQNQLPEVERAYDTLVQFGQSVRKIKRAIESYLSQRLEEELPAVSETLSRSFVALTRHPYYDRLTFAREKLPDLELRVMSSQRPTSQGHPIEVLNGQAESALKLVPHFAFSQQDETPTEVYLVMLDDPTRAFDEEHIQILIERLADLGQRIQLIVASQETMRFQEYLPGFFRDDEYVILEPKNWSYDNGPQLSIIHG